MSDTEQQITGEATSDPVADFLAREQDQLAELDDNFGKNSE